MLDVDKIPTEKVTIEFINEMLDEKKVLKADDVRNYAGIFMGKWVKAGEQDLESINEFKEGIK